MKKIFSVFLISVGVVSAIFTINLLFFLNTPYGDSRQEMVFEKGTSIPTIYAELERRGVISDAFLFRIYVFLKQAGPKIRAGEYVFLPPILPHQVLSALMKGDFATRRITIPPGWNTRDIAAYLESQHLVKADAFLAKCADPIFIQSLKLNDVLPDLQISHLEGYLYPDTYEIYQPKSEEEVIRKMVSRFVDVYAREFAAQAKENNLKDNDVVTLASMIEKETGQASERPLIASVFFNRLKINMPLASDPTIIYSLPNFSGNLTKRDLALPGPYNSYLNTSLPPTPIASPGAEALHAVLAPATTDYLYFVSKNDGTHYFSKTGEEHLEAVRKYQINREVDSQEE